MSRLGKKPINIPNSIKIAVDNRVISVEGPKGKLDYSIPNPITVEVSENLIKVSRPTDSKIDMSLHGLVRTLISNMIKGVLEGY